MEEQGIKKISLIKCCQNRIKMRKNVLIVSFLILCTSCTIDSNKKRVQVIKSATKSILNNDVPAVMSFIQDTAFYFSLYGKEDIIQLSNYTHEHYKNCTQPSELFISGPKYLTSNLIEYIVPFCRDKSGAITLESFTLIFQFDATHDNPIIIQFKKDSVNYDNVTAPLPMK